MNSVKLASAAILAVSLMTGCASESRVENPSREVTSEQLPLTTQPALSAIVVANDRSRSFCPQTEVGAPCLMSWLNAVRYCKANNAHLPTAREYATMLKGSGTVTLEPSEIRGGVPSHFYLVACENEDGSTDAFYMDHSGFKNPQGAASNHLLWTASTPPGHPQYAHVYYDAWGGGGGRPEDHLKEKLNSVQCIQNR